MTDTLFTRTMLARKYKHFFDYVEHHGKFSDVSRLMNQDISYYGIDEVLAALDLRDALLDSEAA